MAVEDRKMEAKKSNSGRTVILDNYKNTKWGPVNKEYNYSLIMSISMIDLLSKNSKCQDGKE